MRKKIKLPLILFVGGFSFSPLAYEALSNFQHTSTDELRLGSSLASKSFKLQRVYQSRSLFSGLFGHGWCSELDKSLEVVRIDLIHYRDCIFDNSFRFKLSHTERGRYFYESLDAPALTLVRQQTGLYLLKDGSKQTLFDSKGFLSKFRSIDASWTLRRDTRGLPYQIQVAGGLLSLRTNDFGQISQINSSSGKSTYSYRRGNLVYANIDSSYKSYTYDAYHNMISVKEPHSMRQMTYNLWVDAVTSITDSDGCVQRRQIGVDSTQVTINCGLGETKVTYDQLGRIVGLKKQGLGRARFSYTAASEIKEIRYKPQHQTERRYTTSKLTDTARDTPELDTLLSLANQLAQAI